MSAEPLTAAQEYDRALRRARHHRLPPDYPRPQPSAAWSAENVALLDAYRLWLQSGGASPDCIRHLYLPTAGHVLGLNLKPHPALDLAADVERTADYLRAKQMGASWTHNCLVALDRFRRFLRQERGQVAVNLQPPNLERYHEGLPPWLVAQLTRYQHLRQANWRPARLKQALRHFWSGHSRLWRWLFQHYAIDEPRDIRRQQVFDYLDQRLAAGYAPSSVNQELRNFQAFLQFLQEQEFLIPQGLLRLKGPKQPERLPRFLTDEQVCRLRDDLDQRPAEAGTPGQRRDALLDRAAFYLLWHGGLRVSEVEELRLEDIDLPGRRLVVRGGKGRRDRAIYLTDAAVRAVQEYLAVRGRGPTEHVFLYHNLPASKDLFRNRLKAAGEREGVKVTPHRLRHTYATQLVNAGCRITSLQKLLGHQRLNATMVYARVHDRTVAADYYAAMAVIEKQLYQQLGETAVGADCREWENGGTCHRLLALVAALDVEMVSEKQRELVQEIRRGLLALSGER
ncbi:MAG: tyrosine-type recombinase/integrase [Anaerolineae bacterium]|nr:tyrosine-type recombinase/integrase [Anaerolineae bacterium]